MQIRDLQTRVTPATQLFYYGAGLLFLALVKARNLFTGYTSPKPIPRSEFEKCFEYDVSVVDGWLADLIGSGSDGTDIKDLDVLELGPGSDLGTGLYLLSLGARSYCAIDAHPLALDASAAYYSYFLQRLAELVKGAEVEALRADLAMASSESAGRVQFVCRDDFDLLSGVGGRSFDLIVSQAAFEHFDDPAQTIAQLSTVARSGARAVIQVDLQTHSGWVRKRDPNNIYRYSDAIYRRFYVRGIPNRVRPADYCDALRQHGWTDIRVRPQTVLPESLVAAQSGFLAPEFRAASREMHLLAVVVSAIRP